MEPVLGEKINAFNCYKSQEDNYNHPLRQLKSGFPLTKSTLMTTGWKKQNLAITTEWY